MQRYPQQLLPVDGSLEGAKLPQISPFRQESRHASTDIPYTEQVGEDERLVVTVVMLVLQYLTLVVVHW